MRDNPYDLSTGRKGFKAMNDERSRDPLDRVPRDRPYRSDIDKANDIARADERSEKGGKHAGPPCCRAAKVINDLISERNLLRAEITWLQAEVQRLKRSQVRTVRSCEEFSTDD